MATYSRVSPEGWTQGDDAAEFSRVTPTGWEQLAAVVAFKAHFAAGRNQLMGQRMRKNEAGQIIGAQMVSSTDGSAFTATVSVFVTKDGGTQAAGSGTVTHEGNGFHSYALTQSDTNADHVAVTFTGTGAVPATIQAYTGFPQTGDSFARLGAPAGASLSADVAAVKTQTSAIETDTQDIQARIPASLVSGRIDAYIGAAGSNVITASTVAADVGTELADALWGAAIPGAYSAGSAGKILGDRVDAAISSRATQTSVDTLTTYVDTEVAAIKAKTDLIPASPAAVSDIPTASTIADAVWDETTGGHTTAGTYGGRILRSGNSNVEVLVTGSNHIAADVHEFQAAVLTSDAIAANAITAAAIASDVAPEVAAGVWDAALASHTTAGSAGLALSEVEIRGARTVVRGTVGSATTPSTTQFTPSSLSPSGASTDQFKGRIVVFDNATTTAALRGQATDITASTNASLPLFTFSALSVAPASGDTFSIL